jgi:tRNA-specific 2-thiouridylase
MSKKVLVAMSGGVDSSVAAMLLKKEGYDVSGVTMCLGIAAEGDSARCCGAEAIDDAKRVCDRLKIPHYVFDYAAELENKIIAKFISEYKKGRTPNPCVECNRHLKFGSLLDKALTLGFNFLATGHYAAIEENQSGYFLVRPKDKKKDQTYFLYPIPYEKLENILFPLASLTKDEVREMAKKASLPVAEKQDSQDICFVTQKNYQEFLLGRGQELKTGPIVDMRGNILGSIGEFYFTPSASGEVWASAIQRRCMLYPLIPTIIK